VATSKAQLHTRFTAQVQQLAAEAGLMHKSVTAGEPRPWQLGDLNGWDGNVTDIPGMAKPFDRSEIGQNFADVYQPKEPGTVGDAATLRVQNDYLAAMERAFRTRHASSVRAAIMAAGRRNGHGSDQGPLLDGVIRYAQDLLKAGQE
jgi:hypothetical protein